MHILDNCISTKSPGFVILHYCIPSRAFRAHPSLSSVHYCRIVLTTSSKMGFFVHQDMLILLENPGCLMGIMLFRLLFYVVLCELFFNHFLVFRCQFLTTQVLNVPLVISTSFLFSKFIFLKFAAYICI